MEFDPRQWFDIIRQFPVVWWIIIGGIVTGMAFTKFIVKGYTAFPGVFGTSLVSDARYSFTVYLLTMTGTFFFTAIWWQGFMPAAYRHHELGLSIAAANGLLCPEAYSIARRILKHVLPAWVFKNGNGGPDVSDPH